ncbi:MAG: glutathione S-transferase family protein [Granulosicoccaceae bacterium]
MYTLIGSPKTRAFRVLWAMEELGLSYDINDALPQSEEIRAVNPSGKVPALAVDGEVIIDSVAIVQYLADKHGGLSYPAGTLERARQDSFTQLICDELDGTCWVLAKHSFVMPKELRQKEAVLPAAQWDMRRALTTLESRLVDSEWLCGDTFTVPDLLLAHCSNWMAVCGFDAPTGKTAALIERIKARPAYLRSMEIREST